MIQETNCRGARGRETSSQQADDFSASRSPKQGIWRCSGRSGGAAPTRAPIISSPPRTTTVGRSTPSASVTRPSTPSLSPTTPSSGGLAHMLGLSISCVNSEGTRYERGMQHVSVVFRLTQSTLIKLNETFHSV